MYAAAVIGVLGVVNVGVAAGAAYFGLGEPAFVTWQTVVGVCLLLLAGIVALAAEGVAAIKQGLRAKRAHRNRAVSTAYQLQARAAARKAEQEPTPTRRWPHTGDAA